MTLLNWNRLCPAALAAAVMLWVAPLPAAEISGAGATFPYPVYAKWADAYKKQTGIGLNYQSIGSGGGIKQIKARTVTFGASDMPLKAEELKQAGLVQWPMVMGGAVPVVNLKGIPAGGLALSGALLAEIYLGHVKTWDDPQVAALNPGVALPKTAIAPVYRSDGSGTNFLFTNYLTKVSPGFADEVGSNTSVQWPVGIGAKGNEGVANMVKQTEGAIGYVEYAYARQAGIPTVTLVNHDGHKVEPKIESFQAAAANADWAGAPGYYVVLTDEPGADSWPITGASFILMPAVPPDAAVAAEALKFFAWAFKEGAQLAGELDYVAMPTAVVALIQKTWLEQIRANGQPVWSPAP